MGKDKQSTCCIAICASVFVIMPIIGCARASKDQAQNFQQPQEQEPSSAEEELKQELEEAPEEMLSSFTLSGYTKAGKKQWDLEGKSADIMTKEISLRDVTSKVYGKEVSMTIVADEGILNRIDNSVHLEKNVQANTDDGATLKTDCLDWDAQNEKLKTDAAVWIKRGLMEAFGTGLSGQPALNLVELKKDVTVKLSLQEATGPAEKQDTNKTPPSKELGGSIPVDELKQGELSIPTIITCSGPLEVQYENNLAVFHDNVKVKDKRGEIFADKMDVYFSTQAQEGKQVEGMEGMGIDKIMAFGDVEIHHGSNTTYSQKALYDTSTGKLTLTGEPKLVIYSTEGFSQVMGSQ